jgi:hypothetical protein
LSPLEKKTKEGRRQGPELLREREGEEGPWSQEKENVKRGEARLITLRLETIGR